MDWHITDQITLNLGGRYTWKKKSTEIARIRVGGCDVIAHQCVADFFDNDKWNAFTPKIGLQWEPSDSTQVYGYFTRGFRSGGYNLRNTSAVIPPGPYDDETMDSFELGAKQDFGGGTRISAALFHNKVKGMQREVIFPVGTSVAQVIRNTANATIKGFDVEGQVAITPEFVINAQVGYVHGKYNSILFDISGDGVVDERDLALKIPRLVPWTYGIGASYDYSLGNFGSLIARVDFNRKDMAYQSDSNATTLPGADLLDASLTLNMRDSVRLSIYGKNLLNELTFTNHSPLPASFGGVGASSATLSKGRVIGGEIRYNF